MTIKTTLTTLSIATIVSLSLIGCGSSSSSSKGDTDTAAGFKTKFKAKSIGDQVEELMGGVIGIADEVGNGKMGDPMGANLAAADTTLVESQFSWNSTMDFYNNILSIKNVWDGGLKEIVEASPQVAQAAPITSKINEALSAIIEISDANGDGILTTSDLIANNGEKAFRNQISNASGRTKIALSQTKLSELQSLLEGLKTTVSPTDAELPLSAQVVDNVIVVGYNKLGTEAEKLLTALTALKDAPTSANVEAARTQWRATREHWEAGEGHIFGPVDTLGVDPKVDSWPVDKTQLTGALGGYDASLSNIDGFPVTMKGFHAIEFLLFGDGSTLENADDAVARLQLVVGDEDASEKARLGYLEALGKSFAKDIKSLVDAWE